MSAMGLVGAQFDPERLFTMNPFYCNPVFSQRDLRRATIPRWWRLWLWLLPTAVQLNDGYVWYYKRWGSVIILVKSESMDEWKLR